jgi:hypothetical protein
MLVTEATLAEDDTQLLKANYLEAFRDAQKSRRKEIVKEAYKQLLESRDKNFPHASRMLVKKVR